MDAKEYTESAVEGTKNTLFGEFIYLAFHQVHARKKFGRPDAEDFANALFGLVESLSEGTYSPDKGAFSTYSYPMMLRRICERYRVLDAVTYPESGVMPPNDERRGRVSVEAAAKYNLTVADVPMTEDFPYGGMEQDTLQGALDNLDPQARRIIEQHYLEGKTVTEIAKEEGISRVWASKLQKRGLERLRDVLKVPPPEGHPQFTPRERVRKRRIASIVKDEKKRRYMQEAA